MIVNFFKIYPIKLKVLLIIKVPKPRRIHISQPQAGPPSKSIDSDTWVI